MAVWGVIPMPNFPSGLERAEYIRRNYMAKCFNTCLQEMLADTDIKFISIFNRIVDKDGISIDRYFMDGSHISQEAMPIAIEEFKRNYPDLADVTLPELYKLHVGGTKPKPGWKIMNRTGGQGIDFTGGLTELGIFDDNSIDEIYISNELEYLDPLTELETATKDVHRVLKFGGFCRVSVPNIATATELITESKLSAEEQLVFIESICRINSEKQNPINKDFTLDRLKGVLWHADFKITQFSNQYNHFKEESSKLLFGTNIMINLRASKLHLTE